MLLIFKKIIQKHLFIIYIYIMNGFDDKQNNNKFSLENYLNDKCKTSFLKNNNFKNTKVKDDDVDYNLFNKFNNYSLIFHNKYNIKQLKTFSKKFYLKISGNRDELLFRLYVFLYLSSYTVKIQKRFRIYLQEKYNKLKGPALLKRDLCTNNTDFLTMEDIKDLNYSQFFSFTDVDGFVYGFNIISIHNLIIKSDKIIKNPYNRNVIDQPVIQNIDNLIKLSKLLKINIEINIRDINNEISLQKSIELKTLDIFQNIDALGNYSDPKWFLSLSRIHIFKFVSELCDIWDYRAQLSIEIKRNICPPHGDPFRNFHINFYKEKRLINIQYNVLKILDRFVNSGIDNDSKSLGAYYVLGALTLVSPSAASSLPWLYQSVNHI
jgi:hypothetical protein